MSPHSPSTMSRAVMIEKKLVRGRVEEMGKSKHELGKY